MPKAVILKIEEVSEPHKTATFKFHLQQLIQRGQKNNVKLLFHGSGKSADFLINSEEGIDPQYSGSGNMWGRAAYFATKASYSDGYAFKNADGSREMLYCEVNLGN